MRTSLLDTPSLVLAIMSTVETDAIIWGTRPPVAGLDAIMSIPIAHRNLCCVQSAFCPFANGGGSVAAATFRGPRTGGERLRTFTFTMCQRARGSGAPSASTI